MKNGSQFLTFLDDLQYVALDSRAEDILYCSIKGALGKVGKAYSSAVINHICKLTRMSEREVLSNCDLFEDSLYRLFGHGAKPVITDVKAIAMERALMEHRLNLTIPEILDTSLTIYDVLNEIRSIEAVDFIHKMAAYSHMAFLYSNKDSLTKILTEFFSPTDAPRVLLSENPRGYNYLSLSSAISYNELFGPVSALIKDDFIIKTQDWIKGICAANKSKTSTTRIAEDDGTWWIRNGHTRALASLERLLCKELPENASILSAFDVSKLNSKELITMKSIIRCHDYVIIEEPFFSVYKSGRRTFRED
jgi:hypothetical protein